MPSTQYAFTRGLDYASIVATSEHVAWTVSEVFGDRSFDTSSPIVPTSWVGTIGVDFLDEGEQRTLNHCRAFSYVSLLGVHPAASERPRAAGGISLSHPSFTRIARELSPEGAARLLGS